MKRRVAVETYYDYVLASERWAGVRARLISARGRQCEQCGVPERIRTLDLHHVTYDRLGFERDDDLKVLCRSCHDRADREREAAVAERAAQVFYAARLYGWASKRYGEDWEYRIDRGEVEDAFEAWLERRGDDDER